VKEREKEERKIEILTLRKEKEGKSP